jgi:hypothetical protein
MTTLHRGALCILAAAAICVGARPARAQSSTDEALSQAITLYDKLEVEQALLLLRRVISPSSPFEVSRDQRVKAYKYLGAALAILGQADSSVVYFRAALERDPFLDLDPARFTQQEQAALAEAKRRSFSVAVRPVARTEWDPSREEVSFTAVTTHHGALRVEVEAVDGKGPPTVIHDREGDGVREIGWKGILGTRMAPEGLYELRLIGTSSVTGRVDSTSMPFTLRHDFPQLEDTLPALGPNELLPERHPPSAGRASLLKGLALASVALLVPRVAGNSDLGPGGNGLAAGAATAAAGAGVYAFVVRRKQPEIPANIAVNNARRQERAAANAEIVRRNAERLALTRLVLIPGAPR